MNYMRNWILLDTYIRERQQDANSDTERATLADILLEMERLERLPEQQPTPETNNATEPR